MRGSWPGVLLAFASFGAASTAAQVGSVAGIVVSAHNGASVAGAVVTVTGTALAAVTRPSGTFSILGVPVGQHTLTVRARGYKALDVFGVAVDVDRTRSLRLELHVGRTSDVERLLVKAPPSVAGLTSALVTLNSVDLMFTPGTDLSSALGITGGYVDLPPSNITLSLQDYRRGRMSTASVRGARPEHTSYMLDDIAVRNPVFGNADIILDPLAASNVSFLPSYTRPEQGNSLAGVVLQTVRVGEDAIDGAVEYGSAFIPGFLSPAAAVSGASIQRGFISGPVPGTQNKLRLHLASRASSEESSVVESMGQGWSGVGNISQRQRIAKASFLPDPTLTFSVTGVSQRRSFEGSDRHFIRGYEGTLPSVQEDAWLAGFRAEKRFPKAVVALVMAGNGEKRRSCSIYNRRCISDLRNA
jgi:hypothetical protein